MPTDTACSVPSSSQSINGRRMRRGLAFLEVQVRFEYPDILRRPTSEVLERFRAGGAGLILLWWTFMLSGLLLIAAAVLLGQLLGFGVVVPVATTIGVLAGLVQMLGLLRWVHRVVRFGCSPWVSR